jgi:hypothetical protein
VKQAEGPINCARPVKVHATNAGTVGELLAAADLTARGYTVYAPICRHVAHADLIAIDQSSPDATPLRIEVRVGKRKMPGGYIAFNRDEVMRNDHYAIVVRGEPVLYEPGLP